MECHRRPDHLQEHRGSHRQAEAQNRLVGLLHGVAALERAQHGRQQACEDAVDDEAGGVTDEHRALAKLRGDVERCRDGCVIGALAADDLDQRQQSDGVEEVHADDALGVREPGCNRGDRERRRVRGQDGFRCDSRLELCEDLPLDLELLVDGLEDEPAVRELVTPRGRPHEETGLPLVVAALGDEACELGLDCGPGALERLLVDVGEDEWQLEPA